MYMYNDRGTTLMMLQIYLLEYIDTDTVDTYAPMIQVVVPLGGQPS